MKRHWNLYFNQECKKNVEKFFNIARLLIVDSAKFFFVKKKERNTQPRLTFVNLLFVQLINFLPLIKCVPQFMIKGKTLYREGEREREREREREEIHVTSFSCISYWSNSEYLLRESTSFKERLKKCFF